MSTSTSPLALALQKADREFRAASETDDEITRPVVIASIPRRLTRDSEPTLRLYLNIPEKPAIQVDDELELPRPTRA